MSALAYAFDEGAGAIAAEASGGPSIAVPAWGPGRQGSALQLSGGVLGTEFSPFSANTDFTVMFDLYVIGPGQSSYTVVLNDYENPGDSAFGNVQITPSGVLDWYLGAGTTATTIPTGSWVNIALTGDGTFRRAYVDGVLAGSATNPNRSGTGPLTLGGMTGYAPNIRIDNLRTEDRALTEAEIAALAGTPVVGSTPPANAIPTANAGVDRSVYVGQQVTLTGTGADADGTVASYSWSQLSGPSVVLSGSGATRTFTPTVTGSYVFAFSVVDDQGDASVPDTVTISVLAIPQEPSASTGTAQPVAKLGSIERALLALLVRDLEVLGGSDARVGGEFPREVDDFYIRIDRIPGGRATTFEGDFVVDIEVFSYDYLRAEDIAEDIEVLMLADGYHTVVSGGRRWTFDGVFQNIGISDFPWEVDEDMNRLGATYAFTVRRGAA